MFRSFVIAIALLFATPAFAGEWYGSLSAGGDQREIEDIIGNNTALEIRGSIGQQFDGWRGEVEYTYLMSQKFNRDDALIFMGYKDFGETMGATPFVGLGAGVMLQGIDIEGGVGQFAAGLAYPVTENIDMTLTYAYRFELEGFDEAGQAVLIGARFAF